jgi:hypothetical protein
MEWRIPMTDVTTAAATPAPTESIIATAAVTDLRAYREQRAAQQIAQQLSAIHAEDAHDGWSLSAFHPFAAAARTNLR